jgi:hypothetical protein
LWWQSAWWIVSKFLSPKKHNRGKPHWTGISYSCAHLHIRILQWTKFHELLINHVGEFAILNCLKNLTRWPWKSIGFQILLRTKCVSSLVKIHWRMLILECSQGCYGRTDGSVTISLCNFVGEGIIKCIEHEKMQIQFKICYIPITQTT